MENGLPFSPVDYGLAVAMMLTFFMLTITAFARGWIVTGKRLVDWQTWAEREREERIEAVISLRDNTEALRENNRQLGRVADLVELWRNDRYTGDRA